MDAEAEVDGLFGVPPEQFVAARDDLARRLRADGQREAAGQVKALRRPSRSAWAVNQLSRHDPAALEELIGAGARLAQAQQRALEGAAGADLRTAAQQRRAAVRRVAEVAAGILRDAGADPDPHRSAIVATLEAASADGGAAAAVREGRLSKDLEGPSGFGDLTVAAFAPADTQPVPEARADADEPGDGDQAEALRETVEQAQRRVDSTAESAAEAARAVKDARRLATDAKAHAERLARQAAAAQRKADAAADHQRQAERDHDQAIAGADAAKQALREAKQRLDDATTT